MTKKNENDERMAGSFNEQSSIPQSLMGFPKTPRNRETSPFDMHKVEQALTTSAATVATVSPTAADDSDASLISRIRQHRRLGQKTNRAEKFRAAAAADDEYKRPITPESPTTPVMPGKRKKDKRPVASAATATTTNPTAAHDSDPSLISRIKQHRRLGQEADRAEKFRAAIEDAAEEYKCPITSELPIDPVMAEDGRVYERTAIERVIEMQGEDLKSPITNAPMGPRLLPAVQVRNSIKLLVCSGAIQGAKAEAWRQKVADEELVADTKKKAEGGDVACMTNLGLWYSAGEKGLPMDYSLAYKWYKKGADVQDARCMASAGCWLIGGVGVEQNTLLGLHLVTIAALSGSEFAAYNLGLWHKSGGFGLPKDIGQAKIWLKKVANGDCTIKNLGHEGRRNTAAHMVQFLEEEQK